MGFARLSKIVLYNCLSHTLSSADTDVTQMYVTGFHYWLLKAKLFYFDKRIY